MQLSDLEHFSMSIISENIGILPLRGKVQHYDWGGQQFIPCLIGQPNDDQKPFAELWMGTHNRGQATLDYQGKTLLLSELIKEYPEVILGRKVIEQFGNQLPFLFKILDVDKMLSIQAHPNKAQAEKGFERENQMGIPRTSSQRNFKDDNHKPEVMFALTEFWLLHGFRPQAAILQSLESVPEFNVLADPLKEKGLQELYKMIMEWPQDRVNTILQPLKDRLLTSLEQNQLHPDQADYWAALGFRDMTPSAKLLDRGIFSIYLLNLVKLQPGQAIFQDAGIPHAYLRGVNVELMANSDNVFRGGLTRKHIDVTTLLDHLIFDPVIPKVISGEKISATETAYPTSAPDFELRRIHIAPHKVHHNAAANSPAIVILIEGEALVNDQLKLNRGEIILIPANIFCTIEARNSGAVLFKAIVP